jgi:hypothetical protein
LAVAQITAVNHSSPSDAESRLDRRMTHAHETNLAGILINPSLTWRDRRRPDWPRPRVAIYYFSPSDADSSGPKSPCRSHHTRISFTDDGSNRSRYRPAAAKDRTSGLSRWRPPGRASCARSGLGRSRAAAAMCESPLANTRWMLVMAGWPVRESRLARTLRA